MAFQWPRTDSITQLVVALVQIAGSIGLKFCSRSLFGLGQQWVKLVDKPKMVALFVAWNLANVLPKPLTLRLSSQRVNTCSGRTLEHFLGRRSWDTAGRTHTFAREEAGLVDKKSSMLPIALIVVSFVCRCRSDSFLSALKAASAANREYRVGSVGVKLSGHSLTIVTIICASSTPILSLVSAVLVISFFACRPIKFYLNFLLKKRARI